MKVGVVQGAKFEIVGSKKPNLVLGTVQLLFVQLVLIGHKDSIAIVYHNGIGLFLVWLV